jgi:hypothetical protein
MGEYKTKKEMDLAMSAFENDALDLQRKQNR